MCVYVCMCVCVCVCVSLSLYLTHTLSLYLYLYLQTAAERSRPRENARFGLENAGNGSGFGRWHPHDRLPLEYQTPWFVVGRWCLSMFVAVCRFWLILVDFGWFWFIFVGCGCRKERQKKKGEEEEEDKDTAFWCVWCVLVGARLVREHGIGWGI